MPSRQFASIHRLAGLILLGLVLLPWPALAANILVVGDSLSAGYGIGRDDAWPNLLARRMAESRDPAIRRHAVINASISGETTAGGRQRIAALLAQHRPGVVILELGANDGLRGLSLAAMNQNLAHMLELSRQAGARPLLVGMRLPPNYGPYADAFQKSFAGLAEQTRTPFVPFLLEGLQQTSEHFQPDGLHPTRSAQTIVLDTIWPALQPLLRPAR